MLTRRGTFQMGVAGAALLASTAAEGRMAQTPVSIQTRRPLANFERTRFLLERRGLDALVVRQRVNCDYFSGYRPYLAPMGFDTPAITVVPRDAGRPVTLIVPSVDLWRLSTKDGWAPELIIPFTAALNNEGLSGSAAPDAYPASIGWPVDEGGFTAKDRRLLETFSQHQDSAVAGPSWGLVKALQELGLTKATIGVDEPELAAMIARHGLEDVVCRDGSHLARRVRMVKTPGEIDMMRQAGQRNAAAANAAMAQLQAGMTQQDIERLYAMEAVKRDLKPVFIVAGSLHGLPHGEVVEGEPILIDAVSSYGGYHGDYGRTYLLGEAPRAFKPKSQKLQIAWQAAFDMIKPGVRYSEISAAAQEAVRKAAIGESVRIVNPHSVGLQHTDEPGVEGLPGFVKDDIVLEEGMTMTVDLPHIEPGWGACHLEDLIVVTSSGAEPLHSMDNPVVEL